MSATRDRDRRRRFHRLARRRCPAGDGYEVTVIDDLSSGKAARVPAGAELRELDIVDLDALRRRRARRCSPRAIFHLAAQASVVASVEDPGRDCEVNVRGHAERCRGRRRMRRLGGVHLDGRRALRRRRADADERAAHPGAAVAVRCLEVGRGGIRRTRGRCPRASRTRSAGSATSTDRARARTARRAWSSIFTHHLHTDQTPKLYGHGTPTRDYVYVGDVVAALLAASGRSGTYNVATGVETDVASVWRELCEAAGQADRARSSRTCARVSCSTAAWTSRARRPSSAGAPRSPIAEGLRKTYAALVEEFKPPSVRRGRVRRRRGVACNGASPRFRPRADRPKLLYEACPRSRRRGALHVRDGRASAPLRRRRSQDWPAARRRRHRCRAGGGEFGFPARVTQRASGHHARSPRRRSMTAGAPPKVTLRIDERGVGTV